MPGGKGGKQKPTPGKKTKVMSRKPVKNSSKVLKKGAIGQETGGPEIRSDRDAEPRPRILPPGKPLKVLEQDWALTPVTNAKKQYSLPDWWKDGALHHQISKTKLSSIAEQLYLVCGDARSEAGAAALKFWYLCCSLAGDKIYDAVRDAAMGGPLNPVRLLWNIPILYSLGPPTPTTDPGQAFDPDTAPIPNGKGFRRFTAVSVKLAELEEIWDAADEAAKHDAEMWRRMHMCLSEAHDLADNRGRGDRLLYPPLEEQWLLDVTPKTKTVIRKGLVRFLGKEAGKRLFRAARTREDISIHDGATWVVEHSHSFHFEGVRVELVVSADVPTIQHICRRHTLMFFDFTSNSERPINTFWQGTGTFLEVRRMVKAALLPSVAQGCIRELLRAGSDQVARGLEIKLGNVPNGPYGTIFFRANIEPLGPNAILAEVKTIAPDGPQALGFLRSELNDIRVYLEILKHADAVGPADHAGQSG